MTLSNKNMNILRDFLIVGCGSFLGGGSRFLVSKLVGGLFATSFPVATFIVNLLGCLLIGFVSSLPSMLSWLSPQARLLLTTGFCGGLTTFSTFMNENLSLANDQNYRVSGFFRLVTPYVRNNVVPLPYGTDQATTCHSSGCAYRQLRCCKF